MEANHPDVDEVLLLVRQHGGRVTALRRTVVEELLEADAHLTADELAARVQASHPDAHRSSVYRALDSLTQLGVVEHIHLGHGGAIYHLSASHHRHLLCEQCGAVIDVPEQFFAELEQRALQDFGFEVHARHFVVLGRCARCAEDTPRRS